MTRGPCWQRTSLRSLAGLLLSLWLGLTSAQAQQPRQESPPPVEAFSLQIDGPEQVTNWLSQHLQLQRYKTLQDLDATELRRLVETADEQARDLLATLGHFAPRLNWRTEPGTAPGPAYKVRLQVEPGRQAMVKEVQILVRGDIEHNPVRQAQRLSLLAQWSLPVGQAFTQDRWSQAKTDTLRRLTAENYPLGRLTESQALVDAQDHSVRLTLTLDSGPQVMLGPLEVRGTERYGDEQAIRLARLPAGQPYRQTDLLEAQQRLVMSGFYDSVFVTLATDGSPQAMPVRIELREVPRQKWVLGLGVRSDNGARISAEYTQHRLPWLDWRAVTKAAADRNLQTLGLDLLSRPNERLWRWTTSAKIEHQLFTGYEVDSQRLRGGRTQIGERIDRTYYAQYDASQSQGSQQGARESLTANYAWTWRYLETLPFPSQGWGLGLEIGTGTTLGERRDPFSRWLAKVLWLQPLGNGSQRLSLRTELGGVVTRNASEIPTTQLFLAGGDRSVRGYALNTIGIESSPGVIRAGRYLATGSAEWQIPIHFQGRRSEWEGTVFVDAGAVADNPGELKAKVGAGVGARWRSPVGPLEIDLAQAQTTGKWRLHMSVGFKF